MFHIVLADATIVKKSFETFKDAELFRTHQIENLFIRRVIFDDRKEYYQDQLRDWMLSSIEEP